MAESKAAIHGAIAANVAIATTKFTAAGVTGSSAMLSEAVHSTVGTGNGLLLLLRVGLRRSKRPRFAQPPVWPRQGAAFLEPDRGGADFRAGRRHFQAFPGMSICEGVQHMLRPKPLTDPFWNYVVLGAAAPPALAITPPPRQTSPS